MLQFLSDRQIWPAITRLCATSDRRWICMAYLGHTAAELLPARSGDVVVVDASRRALQAGSTDPHAIRLWLDLGVRVVSLEALHAKIVVADGRAIIGSNNASANSAEQLFEAALLTDQGTAVHQARSYIEHLARSGDAVVAAWLRTEAVHFRQGQPLHLRASPAEVDEGDEVVWVLEGTTDKMRYHRHSLCHGMKQQQAKAGHEHRQAVPASRREVEGRGRVRCDLPNCWR